MKDKLLLTGKTYTLRVHTASMKFGGSHAWWNGTATLVTPTQEHLAFEFKTANRHGTAAQQLVPELLRINFEADHTADVFTHGGEDIDQFCIELEERFREEKKKGLLFPVCIGPKPNKMDEPAIEKEIVSEYQLKLPKICEIA